jgi:hypothetical protein
MRKGRVAGDISSDIDDGAATIIIFFLCCLATCVPLFIYHHNVFLFALIVTLQLLVVLAKHLLVDIPFNRTYC